MTISTTASRISYNGNGSTVAFSFPYRFLTNADLTVIRVAANGTETTLALGTDYTVTGADDDAGGTVTCVTAPVSGARLVIYRSVAITQEVDYITGDSFPAETHERALDRLTMVAQQLQDAVDRSAKLSETSTADADTLVTNINSLAAIEDDVSAVAAIDTDVSAVAAVDSAVTTVAGISANVTTVAGISSAVSTVAADGTDIGAVAAISADVQAVADIAADVSAVENIAANVTTVADVAANVTTVAGISANVTTVATNAAAVSTVSTNIASVNSAATNMAAIIAAPTEASNAAASAVSAAASAAAAAASFDAFDDIYLGAKSSDPSVDNDGNALTTGDQYFNTSANELRVYNGSTWQAASTVGGTVTSLSVTGNTTLGDATADSVTVNAGTLNFAQTGQRITGDFSNATAANRVIFQTSTTNGATGVIAIPNGTGVAAAWRLYSSSDTANASVGDIAIGPAGFEVRSYIAGTGTYMPMLFSTGGSERMRVDTSGNVGIGTSSPTWKTTVVNGSTPRCLQLSQYSTNNTDKYSFISAGHYTSSTYTDGFALIGGVGSSGANAVQIGGGIGETLASSVIQFYTAANNTTTVGTERGRFDSSGNLLVGTTSATVGSVTCAQVLDARTRNSGFGFGIIGNASNTQVARFAYDSTAVGAINVAVSSTSYATSSDYRLKHDIAPMIDALTRVAALKPVTYKWNVDGSDGQGFIAHELQAVVPDAVVGEKDAVDAEGNPVYQGIDTSFLVATLTAAIQELKAINDAQAQTITALTARVTALETN